MIGNISTISTAMHCHWASWVERIGKIDNSKARENDVTRHETNMWFNKRKRKIRQPENKKQDDETDLT